MEITIKKIFSLAAVSMLTTGLASCSSSPAPWTQENDSPWQSKRDAEATAETPPADTYNDPVLLADPEPLAEPIAEPIVMEEPEPAPAPEVIVPVMVEDNMAAEGMTAEQEVMNLPGSNFAVQVYASKTVESAEKFKADNDLSGLKVVKTDRAGEPIYVVVDIHPDRATATAAASDIEAKTGSKPWVRSIAGLQKVVMQ